MSLLAAAKQNSLQPRAWLEEVPTRLPTHLNSRIHKLLLHSWQQIAQPSRHVTYRATWLRQLLTGNQPKRARRAASVRRFGS